MNSHGEPSHHQDKTLLLTREIVVATVLRKAKIANVYCNMLIVIAIAFDCRPTLELPDPKGNSALVHHPASRRQESVYDELVLEAELQKGQSEKGELAKAQGQR